MRNIPIICGRNVGLNLSTNKVRQGALLRIKAITVRRDSDNATTTIYVKNGAFDTSALLSFCTGTNGYVTTWHYDDGDLMSQPLASLQPKIVENGVLVDPELSMFFDGIDDHFDTGLEYDLSSGDFTVYVRAKLNTALSGYIIGQTHTVDPYSSDFIIVSSSNIFWFRTVPLGSKTLIDDGAWHDIQMVWDKASERFEGFVDGASIGTSSVVYDYGGIGTIKIGTRGDATTFFLDGFISKVKIYNAKKTPTEVSLNNTDNLLLSKTL